MRGQWNGRRRWGSDEGGLEEGRMGRAVLICAKSGAL